MVNIVCVLMLLVPALSFDCKTYGAGSADRAFCQESACRDYCAKQANPESCMETYYSSPGICTKSTGLTQDICKVVVGINPDHTHFCQTDACDYAVAECRYRNGADCEGDSQRWILNMYLDLCKAAGASQEPTNKPADPAEDEGSCVNKCPLNTLQLKRPQFRGPSCYNSEHGSQFGPNWVPTGRTNFERYVPNPTALYKIVRTTTENLPWLQKTWGLKGCDAAAAVYENIVCAIELIDSPIPRQFEGAKWSVGNFITDFANSGDQQTDRRELAAFFSHMLKETFRLQNWEETPTKKYAECSSTQWPCGSQPYYHGRGPAQLKGNLNYGPLSEFFYGNKMFLLNEPDKLDPEGPMGFIAAFWFWFTPRQFTSSMPISGSIRPRDAIVHWTDGKMNQIYPDGVDYDSVAGLGLSTNVINGGVECKPFSESVLWRVQYFLTVAARIGAPIPDVNDHAACKADKYCKGLFSGCISFNGLTCKPIENLCGPAYVDGWHGQQCTGIV